jgi:hypothetical protein
MSIPRPSLSSSPAGRSKREEPLRDDDADFDDRLDYQPSEGEDDEADGDGDDYPGGDLNAELGELQEEAKDTLPSPEDPPPPPYPASQTAAADPDSNAEVPLWYLLLLALFSMTAFLLLKWSFVRIPCRAFACTAVISSLAGATGFAAPFQLEDDDTVRRAVESDNAALLEVIVLPPVVMIAVAVVVLAASVLVDMWWRAREAEDGELVILFS